MFLVNLGYKWTSYENADGIVLNASSVHFQQLVHRPMDFHFSYFLFDPQLYLSGIDCEYCKTTCARLTTYPWFGGSQIDYDSDEYTLKDWFDAHKASLAWDSKLPDTDKEIKQIIKDCLDFQNRLGVTHLIIPIPLVENPEDDFLLQAKWIDLAMELKSHYQKPILASVAFIDQLLIHEDPMSNKLAISMLDNLSTREELDGIYVVPVQIDDSSSRLENRRVTEFLLHLSNIVGREKIVVINYSDTFGYACVSAGADAFASGYTNKTKRMCLTDFIDKDSGGPAYPRFYSHKLILDLLPRDITKLQNNFMERLLYEDETTSSADLIRALKSRTSIGIPAWREGPNNVNAAMNHRILLLKKETELLRRITDKDKKETHCLEWLQDAEAYNAIIISRLSENPISDSGRHISVWRSSFENYLRNR